MNKFDLKAIREQWGVPAFRNGKFRVWLEINRAWRVVYEGEIWSGSYNIHAKCGSGFVPYDRVEYLSDCGKRLWPVTEAEMKLSGLQGAPLTQQVA